MNIYKGRKLKMTFTESVSGGEFREIFKISSGDLKGSYAIVASPGINTNESYKPEEVLGRFIQDGDWFKEILFITIGHPKLHLEKD